MIQDPAHEPPLAPAYDPPDVPTPHDVRARTGPVAPSGRASQAPSPPAAGRPRADAPERAGGGSFGTPDRSGILGDLDTALRAAVARFYASGDRTPDPAVQAAVSAVTDALHADGRDIVTALRMVKIRMAAADVPPGGIFDAAVRWCIMRYYADAIPSAPVVPSTDAHRRDAPRPEDRPT